MSIVSRRLAYAISWLAAAEFDLVWANVLASSTLFSICTRTAEKLQACLRSSKTAAAIAGKIGTAAECLSFLAALVLLAALPAPQFAADKEGLAVLALGGIALYAISRMCSSTVSGAMTLDGRAWQCHAPTIVTTSTTAGATTQHNYAGSSTVDMLVIMLFCSNIASTFASHYFQASVTGLAKVLIYVLSYFWLKAVVAARPHRSTIAIGVLLASGLSTALYGFYQYHTGVEALATWEDPTIEQKATRIYSTLGNPNLLAGYLTPLAPLAVSLGLMSFFKRRYVLSAITLATALALSIAIVLTGSRGAYIAAAAWILFLLAAVSQYVLKTRHLPRPYLLLPAAALVLAAIAAMHFLPTLSQRILSIFAGSEHSSNAFRLNVWRASWHMFLDNWWLGIGPGNKTFILAYGLYMLSGFDALGTYCVPLEFAVETGIPGLLIFAALITVLMSRAHLVFHTDKTDDFSRWLSVGCAAAICGMMVHGLVDTVFFRPQVQFIFWLLAALIASTYRRSYANAQS